MLVSCPTVVLGPRRFCIDDNRIDAPVPSDVLPHRTTVALCHFTEVVRPSDRLRRQLVQQCFGLFRVERVEAFLEQAVDAVRRLKASRLLYPSLIAPKCLSPRSLQDFGCGARSTARFSQEDNDGETRLSWRHEGTMSQVPPCASHPLGVRNRTDFCKAVRCGDVRANSLG